jgi:TonB family protein
MKKSLLFLLIFFPLALHAQQKSAPLPDEIIIGRHSFIDIGPPFDFYDVERIRRDGSAVLIEKVAMTPDPQMCFRSATVSVVRKKMIIKYEELLGGINPCDLSPKQAKRESKRKKHTLSFAGENSKVQYQCGEETRILTVNVHESDIFDTHWKTPTLTAWFMKMVGVLDKETGSSMWDDSIFKLDAELKQNQEPQNEPEILKEVAAGKYDKLFDGPDLPSVMYRDAQVKIVEPTIQLVSSMPIMPNEITLPTYPPIAKAARVEGVVVVDFKIGEECKPMNLQVKSGPKMLEQTSKEAISKWKYCPAKKDQEVEVTFDFKLNCQNVVRTSVSDEHK